MSLTKEEEAVKQYLTRALRIQIEVFGTALTSKTIEIAKMLQEELFISAVNLKGGDNNGTNTTESTKSKPSV